MSDTPLTFSQWRELSANGPAAAARLWLRRVNLLDEANRRAALAFIPTAEALEEAWTEAVEQGGDLAGVPYLAKDLFDVAGWPTTASSTFLAAERGEPVEDAAIVEDLRKTGAVVAGKAHLNEFAYGLSGENAHFGDCPHPDCGRLLSGGSSSGSAWAVGAGLVPFSLGTDTGGSIRAPASFCGLYGLRLTPDERWSREGCFPLAASFDAAGFLARTKEDLRTLTNLVPSSGGAKKGKAGRGGLWLGDLTGGMDGALLEALEGAALKLDCAQDPEVARQFAVEVAGSRAAFNILQSSEAYALHHPWLKRFAEAYDPATLARIRRAEAWTPDDLDGARTVREEVGKVFTELLGNYDYLVLPATPCPAVAKSDLTSEFRELLLGLTTPASMASLPALTLPVFLDPLRSVGLQIIFPRERLEVVAEKLLG